LRREPPSTQKLGVGWQGIAETCGSAFAIRRFVLESVSISLTKLGRRTWRDAVDDDVLGLAAQLSC